MFLSKPRVKCFNAEYGAGSYVDRADLGYQVVPVERIIGSVGRCQELDQQFQPLKLTRLRQERLDSIRRLVDRGANLPPVELYKLKDEYFVVDGNHRVAVAKENGQTYLDAHVVEYLPNGERAEDRLYLERRAFAAETGLEGIRLGQLGGYARLRQEIAAHQQQAGTAPAEAARDWYRQVFEPVTRELAARRLPARAGKTAGDLYLDLQGLRAYALEQEGRELSWNEAILRLEALYPRPTLRARLAQGCSRLLGEVEAWWRGLRAEELPCAYAAQAPGGTIYCRRAARAKRGLFEG